jgi:hypothetical protein
MQTTTDHTSANGGDPAEQALMEEFSRYLAAVSKSASEPMIAAMHQQERQLRECIQKLEESSVRQSTLISRWMTLTFLVLLAEGALIIRLLMR